MCVFLFLAAVLANEGAILIELSIPTLPVIYKAVITLITAHRSIGWCTAALQWLVVLCVTAAGGNGSEKITNAGCFLYFFLQWSETLVPTQRTGSYQA